VIVTLIYLAAQIRQNTRVVRPAAHHSKSQGWNDLNAALGSDAEAARILLQGSRGYSDLKPEERFRFTLLMRAIMGRHEAEFFQIREGLVDADLLLSQERALASALTEPGAREFWEKNGDRFSEIFQSHVAQVLSV